MKLSFNTLVLLAVAVQGALASPIEEVQADAVDILAAHHDDWKCNGSRNDGGLKRLSFIFHGYCEDRSGQCFLDRLRARALTVHNWQAWDRGDGWWQVDFSTTAGLAWQANNAIEDVTGTWRGCWPNE